MAAYHRRLLQKAFIQNPLNWRPMALKTIPRAYPFWKIKHGIRWTGMPSWKDLLIDQQIWTLALFLKHMDKLPPRAQSAWQEVKN